MLKTKQENKGITLVALVVTIIVLLILAGTTNTMLMGENGIITKAVEAKRKTEEAIEKEMSQIENLDKYFSKNKISSLFSWDINAIDNYSELKNVTDYLKINTIYSGKDESEVFDLNSENYKLLLNFAEQNDIDVWILEGNRNDVENNNIQKYKNLMDKIYEFNRTSNNKIKGLSIDLEFYITSTYKNATNEEQVEMLKEYVDFIKECYKYAKTKNLQLANCVPTFLDQKSETYLEDLIANGCDYIQIMNYTKSDMLNAIDKEVEIAKKYNKKIENIAELQIANDYNGVTDENTFYTDGILRCIETFKEMDEKYSYNLLGYSYHYYLPVKKLVGDVVDFTKTFDYELYPKDSETYASANVKDICLFDGTEYIYGMPFKVGEEYIFRFYGLKYDKEYKVVIKDDFYTGTKTIMYNNSSDRIKYDDIEANKEATAYLELYGWTDGDANEVSIDSGRLISGGDIIEGEVVSVNSSTGEGKINILCFPKVLYNKEYTLEVEANGYTLSRQYVYKFEDTNTTEYYKEIFFNNN